MCCYSPLGALQVTAGDSMTLNNFSQEADVSSFSQSIHISLQHHIASVGSPRLIVLSIPMGRPSCVPITSQSAAYCGVMYCCRSLSNGVVFTIVGLD